MLPAIANRRTTDDANVEGTMRQTVTLMMFLLLSPVASAEPTYNPEKNADEQLAAWDSDGNNLVSMEEFSRSASARFQHMDTNADGITTLEEWLEFHPTKKIVAQNLMKRWDTNGDNTISRDEYLSPMRVRFENLDSDKDGQVTRSELIEHWTRKKEELDTYWERDAEE